MTSGDAEQAARRAAMVNATLGSEPDDAQVGRLLDGKGRLSMSKTAVRVSSRGPPAGEA
jgi:hypothetical protein